VRCDARTRRMRGTCVAAAGPHPLSPSAILCPSTYPLSPIPYLLSPISYPLSAVPNPPSALQPSFPSSPLGPRLPIAQAMLYPVSAAQSPARLPSAPAVPVLSIRESIRGEDTCRINARLAAAAQRRRGTRPPHPPGPPLSLRASCLTPLIPQGHHGPLPSASRRRTALPSVWAAEEPPRQHPVSAPATPPPVQPAPAHASACP
jgi:hypothetical protein